MRSPLKIVIVLLSIATFFNEISPKEFGVRKSPIRSIFVRNGRQTGPLYSAPKPEVGALYSAPKGLSPSDDDNHIEYESATTEGVSQTTQLPDQSDETGISEDYQSSGTTEEPSGNEQVTESPEPQGLYGAPAAPPEPQGLYGAPAAPPPSDQQQIENTPFGHEIQIHVVPPHLNQPPPPEHQMTQGVVYQQPQSQGYLSPVNQQLSYLPPSTQNKQGQRSESVRQPLSIPQTEGQTPQHSQRVKNQESTTQRSKETEKEYRVAEYEQPQEAYGVTRGSQGYQRERSEPQYAEHRSQEAAILEQPEGYQSPQDGNRIEEGSVGSGKQTEYGVPEAAQDSWSPYNAPPQQALDQQGRNTEPREQAYPSDASKGVQQGGQGYSVQQVSGKYLPPLGAVHNSIQERKEELEGLNGNIVDSELLERVQQIIADHEREQKSLANNIQKDNEAAFSAQHSQQPQLRGYSTPQQPQPSRDSTHQQLGGYSAPQPAPYSVPQTGSYSAPQQSQAGGYSAHQQTQTGYSAPQQSQTGGYSSPQQSKTRGYSAPQQSQTGGYSAPQQTQTGGYSTPQQSQTGGHSTPQQSQTGGYSAPQQSQTGGYSAPQQTQTGGYSAPQQSQAGGYSAPQQTQTGGYSVPQQSQAGGYLAPQQTQTEGYSAPQQPQTGGYTAPQQSQTGGYSAAPQITQTRGYSAPQKTQTGGYSTPQQSQSGGYSAPQITQTRGYSAPQQSQAGGYSEPQQRQTGGYSASEQRETGGYSTAQQRDSEGYAVSQSEKEDAAGKEAERARGYSGPRVSLTDGYSVRGESKSGGYSSPQVTHGYSSTRGQSAPTGGEGGYSNSQQREGQYSAAPELTKTGGGYSIGEQPQTDKYAAPKETQSAATSVPNLPENRGYYSTGEQRQPGGGSYSGGYSGGYSRSQEGETEGYPLRQQTSPQLGKTGSRGTEGSGGGSEGAVQIEVQKALLSKHFTETEGAATSRAYLPPRSSEPHGGGYTGGEAVIESAPYPSPNSAFLGDNSVAQSTRGDEYSESGPRPIYGVPLAPVIGLDSNDNFRVVSSQLAQPIIEGGGGSGPPNSQLVGGVSNTVSLPIHEFSSQREVMAGFSPLSNSGSFYGRNRRRVGFVTKL